VRVVGAMNDTRKVRILTNAVYEFWAAADVSFSSSTTGGIAISVCHNQTHQSEAEARNCPEGRSKAEIVRVARDERAEFPAYIPNAPH
jgi:hypothetical protein